MSDLISREGLINKAEYEAEAMPEPFKSQLPVLVAWLAEKIPSEEPAPQWIPCTEGTKFDEFKECWVTMSNGKVKKLYYNPEYMPYPWITEFGSLVFGNKEILAYILIEEPEPYQSESEESE